MTTDERERTVVYLGNRDAIQILDGERTPIDGAPRNNYTFIRVAADTTLLDAATEITRDLWVTQSDALAPAWVASSDPALAQLLADHWGCEIREVETDHVPSGADDLVEG
jgi:hypothetical protein